MPIDLSQLGAGHHIYDTSGKVMGNVTHDGHIYDVHGTKVGYINPDDGHVSDVHGTVVGKLGHDGRVFDSSGIARGTEGGGKIYHEGKEVGYAHGSAGAAAALLLFRKKS